MQMYVEVQIMHFSVPFSTPQAKFFISLEKDSVRKKHHGFKRKKSTSQVFAELKCFL